MKTKTLKQLGLITPVVWKNGGKTLATGINPNTHILETWEVEE